MEETADQPSDLTFDRRAFLARTAAVGAVAGIGVALPAPALAAARAGTTTSTRPTPT
ncbi:twin-arginine translocation signal domain-containing protein [Streptosporangium lutulentum]